MYEYKVKEVIKVYDGDTITVTIDLGMHISNTIVIRLFGIDTPEIRGVERPQGLESKKWLKKKLLSAVKQGQCILIRTHKDKKGKYGRMLGELFLNSFDTVSLNTQLVELGLAEVNFY